MHFFNPVPVMALVEVVRAPRTSDETADRDRRARARAREDAGRGERLSRLRLEPHPDAVHQRGRATRSQDGVADAEAIDTIAKLGFNHPIGPLALADLIGLDTCVAIMEVLHDGLGDEKYAPAPLLREHVAAGRLGRKSGQRLLRVPELVSRP